VNGAAGGKCHNKADKLNTLSARADVDGILLCAAVSLDAGVQYLLARERVCRTRESIYFPPPDDFLFNRSVEMLYGFMAPRGS
jgi:hypothetical protein